MLSIQALESIQSSTLTIVPHIIAEAGTCSNLACSHCYPIMGKETTFSHYGSMRQGVRLAAVHGAEMNGGDMSTSYYTVECIRFLMYFLCQVVEPILRNILKDLRNTGSTMLLGFTCAVCKKVECSV